MYVCMYVCIHTRSMVTMQAITIGLQIWPMTLFTAKYMM